MLLATTMVSNAQIVKGYFPYYRSAADVANVQYTKLTDIVYAFAAVDANGNLQIMGPGGTPDLSLFTPLKNNCTTNGVRLWIAIGGWGLSGNFSSVAANTTKRNTLATACLNLCTTYGLAGIDIDWEFPAAGDKTNYTAMLAAIKSQLGSTYKLSAALGGESFNYSCVASGHAVGVEPAAFAQLDYFNVMTYDAPSCFPNHSSLDFMTRSMDGWNALGCPYSKMIPGIAFYTASGLLWSSFATAARFNDADGIDGGTSFDSKLTIEAKINQAMAVKGSPGVMVWELSQDLPGSNPLNLTTVMKNAVDANACPIGNPSLGPDQSLCGVASILLNSNIAAATGRTFSWKKDGSGIAGTGPTLSISTGGTYEVTIVEGTCTKNDIIVITAVLPTPDLGSNKVICDPATYNLVPANLATFPGSTTWQWKKDGSDIAGATASTLSNVRVAGIYRLTASIIGCSSTLQNVTLTSTIATPADGCASTAPVFLSISNAVAGPYSWYDMAIGGTLLITGTSYSAPASGTYYVQDGASSPPYYIGLAGPANSFQNPTGTTIGMNFTTTNTVTINFVDVYVPTGASGNVQIKIRNNANTADVLTGPVTAVNNSTGAIQKIKVPVGGSLPAGSYKMVDVGTVNLHVNSAPTYPINVTDVSITSSFGLGSYAFFFNWEIAGSGSSCKRLPVIATVNASCAVAPVTLMNFSAAQKEGYVVLNWTTAQEIDNNYFILEKSSDAIHFSELVKMNGHGTTSTIQEYYYSDRDLNTDKIYYRLAQYDFDGTVHYSSVVSIETIASSISLAPNPFSTSSTLLIYGKEEKINFTITDIQGRLIEQGTSTPGQEMLIGEKLSAGTYILQIQFSDRKVVKRIIKE